MSLKERIYKLEKEIIEIKQKLDEPILNLIQKKLYEIETANMNPLVLFSTQDSMREISREFDSILAGFIYCRKLNVLYDLKVIISNEISGRFAIGVE